MIHWLGTLKAEVVLDSVLSRMLGFKANSVTCFEMFVFKFLCAFHSAWYSLVFLQRSLKYVVQGFNIHCFLRM